MKVGKKNKILILLICLICITTIYFILEKKTEKEEDKYPSFNIDDLLNGQDITGEEGLPTKEFKIASGEKTYPRFVKSVFFKPYNIAIGDGQAFSIWVEDLNGVEKVQAEIESDLETRYIEMEIIEGNKEMGLWKSTWHVCDLRKKEYYQIVFRAFSESGEEGIFTTFIRNKEVL